MGSLLRTRALLRALASGKPVSGEALAARLGVTRAAVWKHVRALREMGLPVRSEPGHGYVLPWTTQALGAAAIRQHLGRSTGASVDVCWAVDSTQDEVIRRQAKLDDLAVILAETQWAGRGRRGRAWVSPPGTNIYLSCLKRFDAGFAAISGLSLAVGVCVIRALQDAGIEGVGLKWPNDVVVGSAKLAGVLIELGGEYQGPCCAVIGVGLNVRLPSALRRAVAASVADLAQLTGGSPPDRNRLAACLIAWLRDGLGQFEVSGLASFMGEFQRLDRLRGVPLRLQGRSLPREGIGAGVDRDGALRVQTARGEVRVTGGDVTVRPVAR